MSRDGRSIDVAPHLGNDRSRSSDAGITISLDTGRQGTGGPEALARAIARDCDVEQTTIVAIDPDNGRCTVLAIVGPDLLTVGTSAPAELSTRLQNAIQQRTWSSADFRREPGFERAIDQMATVFGFRSGSSIPIVMAGRVVGAVLLTSTMANRSWERETAAVEAVAPLLALELGLGRAEARLRVLVAHPDPLIAHGLARIVEHGLSAQVTVVSGPVDPQFDDGLAQSEVILTGEGGPSVSALRRRGGAGAESPVVVVATDDGPSARAQARAEGAAAVVARSVDTTDLITTVARVVAGRRPSRADRESDGMVPALTRRERQLLHELQSGMPYKRIAARMGLSEATVRGYSRGLYAKLDVHSRGEAVHEAHRQGWLSG